MSKFDKGAKITATDITALKASVKAEMLRRNLTGSLAEFGSATYDFTVQPTAGNKVLGEHYSKIREPISKINSVGLPPQNPTTFPSLTTLDGKLALYKTDTGKSSTTHNCMASCSGLCFNSCSSCSSCSGCSGCGSGCDGGCSGCGGACSSCTSCAGDCKGCQGCGNACGYACTGSCEGYCTGGCTGGCSTPSYNEMIKK